MYGFGRICGESLGGGLLYLRQVDRKRHEQPGVSARSPGRPVDFTKDIYEYDLQRAEATQSSAPRIPGSHAIGSSPDALWPSLLDKSQAWTASAAASSLASAFATVSMHDIHMESQEPSSRRR